MSNLAVSKRVWAVDVQGTVVESKPAPAKSLTSGQRHYMYRIGLMAVDAFMKERGFRNNTTFEGGSSLSYEHQKGGKYVWIDVALKKPGNIAFVTSGRDYVYSKDKINAKVTTAKDILGSDMLVQVIVSTNDAGGSRQPVYVPLPKTLDKPARYVLDNVLGALAAACDAIPAVKDAFTREKVKAEVYQELDLQAAQIPEDCD